MKICHLETVMRESPRSPALLAQFISEENAHNSYPGVFKLEGPTRGRRPRRGCAIRVPPAVCSWGLPMMSRGDRFTSAIVRHVCGVRSLSAKVAVVGAQRVWCTVSESTDERVDGGNEEVHRSGLQNKCCGMRRGGTSSFTGGCCDGHGNNNQFASL